MKKLFVWPFVMAALLFSVSACKQKSAFSPEELDRMSLFLSNFTELGMYDFRTEDLVKAPGAAELIRFGIRHNYINNPNSRIASCKDKGCPYGSLVIEAKYVSESLKKYFNIDFDGHNSIESDDMGMRCHYDGQLYHFEGADGESVFYARVEKATRKPSGQIVMTGRLYNVENEDDLLGSFEAVAVPHQYNGKDTWAIVSFKAEYDESFLVRDGFLYKNGEQLDYEVHQVPDDIQGFSRFWAICPADINNSGEEGKIGVWFFGEDGYSIHYVLIENEMECQDVIFSPDQKHMLFVSGSGMRPDIAYVLYDGLNGERKTELYGLRGQVAWVDYVRFVFTQVEGTRGTTISQGFALSVVMYDTAISKPVELKEFTPTANYLFDSVIKENGVKTALNVIEEYVDSPKDWTSEKKVKTRKIRVEIPAAG